MYEKPNGIESLGKRNADNTVPSIKLKNKINLMI
jgi:hypothetical protein